MTADLQTSINRLGDAVRELTGRIQSNDPVLAVQQAMNKLVVVLTANLQGAADQPTKQAATKTSPPTATNDPPPTSSDVRSNATTRGESQAWEPLLQKTAAQLLQLNQNIQQALLSPILKQTQVPLMSAPAQGMQGRSYAIPAMTQAFLSRMAGNTQERARDAEWGDKRKGWQEKQNQNNASLEKPETAEERKERRAGGIKEVGSGILKLFTGQRSQGTQSIGQGIGKLFGMGGKSNGEGGEGEGPKRASWLQWIQRGASALMNFAQHTNKATDSQLQAMQKYAQASASMSLVMSQLKMSETFRGMRMGERLSPSARYLSEAKQEVNKNSEEITIFIGRFWNNLYGFAETITSKVLMPVNWIAKQLNDWLGDNAVQAMDATMAEWLIAIDKESQRKRDQGQEFFDREGGGFK